MGQVPVWLDHILALANAVVGGHDHGDLRSQPNRFVDVGIVIVLLKFRIVERKCGHGGPQYVHRKRVFGSNAQEVEDRRVEFALFARGVPELPSTRYAEADGRTRAGSRFPRNLSGRRGREYRCHDTPELPVRRRCNRCWRWWQQRLQDPWARASWLRWTYSLARLQMISVAGPRGMARESATPCYTPKWDCFPTA